jgi:katanin p60 ATPase-containing subunit A1
LKEEKRKRNLMVLIISHLKSNGYSHLGDLIQKETNLYNLTAADNIELIQILQEFETFYSIKFGKSPIFVRTALENNAGKNKKSIGQLAQPRLMYFAPFDQKLAACLPKIEKVHEESGERKLVNNIQKRDSNLQDILDVNGKKIGFSKCNLEQDNNEDDGGDMILETDDKLRTYPEYLNQEKALAASISAEIFLKDPNVRWDDVAGLEECKRRIREAVVFPIKYPKLFNFTAPWKGILLFGQPGVGKTLLAKAIATECKTTFFNISASSIVSKWRGDSEKLVRVLFDLARYHAPSTIFIDEIESIMSVRSLEEHEGSRRMKTEILIQLDGMDKYKEHVFLLAATNLPWDLDPAMLRRLEKKIFIDLPNIEARKTLFKINLPRDIVDGYGNKIVDSGLDYDIAALRTEGYSGSDIALICKEASMSALRELFENIENGGNTKRRLISTHDILKAIEGTKPTKNDPRYAEWGRTHGML